MLTKFKKPISFILLLVLCLNMTTVVFAEQSKNIMALEGPTVVLDLDQLGEIELERDEHGLYRGDIDIYTPRAGITAISVVLSGGVGGISSLYHVLLRWTGTVQVAHIKYSSLTIKDTAILSPKTYYSAGARTVACGMQVSGFASLGNASIPPSVKKVKIAATGLSVSFPHQDYWIQLTPLSGTVNVN